MLWFEDLIKDAKITLDSRLGREIDMEKEYERNVKTFINFTHAELIDCLEKLNRLVATADKDMMTQGEIHVYNMYLRACRAEILNRLSPATAEVAPALYNVYAWHIPEMNLYIGTPEEAERRIADGKKVVPLYARFDNA